MNDLEQRLRQQALQCRTHGSPLTWALLQGAADDLVAGGVVADLLAAHAYEPSGSVPSLRLAGSLHRLVLEGRAPELAQHYPSVGGTARVAEVWPAAERVCREHLDELRYLVTLPVQTNEVGRSAALFGALQLLGGPIRLLEIGASAGLNLRCDAFAYELGGDVLLGDPASPVRLHRPWEGTHPPYSNSVEVLERKGCDPSPVDTTTAEGRLTLRSYVWADQVERLDRLSAASQVASGIPAVVEKAGALEFLSRELAELPAGVTTVVWHSVVWQYVDPVERRAVNLLLDRVGVQATDHAPLARVSLEPEQIDGGGFLFRVHLQRWPNGERVHVADALGHGPPVCWTGEGVVGR
ncbi:MAG: hypothetical protein JWM02_2345 [Frankiales bacterium]|nr:hypothetical protein [Frankiales bacterium]